MHQQAQDLPMTSNMPNIHPARRQPEDGSFEGDEQSSIPRLLPGSRSNYNTNTNNNDHQMNINQTSSSSSSSSSATTLLSLSSHSAAHGGRGNNLILPTATRRHGRQRRSASGETKTTLKRTTKLISKQSSRGAHEPPVRHLAALRAALHAQGDDSLTVVIIITLLTLLTIAAIAATTTTIITPVQGYNLDHQKALPKRGPSGSYFGYSIAQHETFDETNRNASYRSYVIVGAPRDSPRTAIGVQRPGAIYKCDFSRSEKCHLLELDSFAPHLAYSTSSSSSSSSSLAAAESSSLLQSAAGSPPYESRSSPTGFITAASRDPVIQKDDQWLGVSVKSQGPNGYAVACAHRYVLKGPNYRWPQGICYSMTKNLTHHKTWQPCLNRPVNKAHEEYGFCQAGTSVDISNSSDIVLGSPGPYTWRGTVFTNSITFRAKDDRTWYMAPVQDEEAKVYKYSYLGMSIVTGAFFNNQQYFISGAPRSNEMGQVLVMTKQSGNGKHGDSSLRTDQILDGEQMASSFGYTLAKLDFNGDTRLDLAVAAPFYYSKNEGGAVYLYSNNGKSFVPAGKLTGQPESRFGFALASCGDLNHDKYEDLAVGAPYEQGGGAVYIYLGSAQGLKTSPSQVIKASQMQTFGYSLSGGVDMDQNGYPDLAVGSYADDTVHIIRARPIIEISTKIEGNLSRIDPNRTTCDGERNAQLPCFKFNTCFELDPAKIGEYSDSMKLKYRIEAETFTGQKYSRVKFGDSENSDRPNVVEREIMIDDYHRSIKLKRCNTQRVYLKDRSDVQTPIQFKLEYWLVAPDEAKTAAGAATGASSSRYTSNQLISYSSSSSYSSSTGNLPASSLLSSLSSSSSSGYSSGDNSNGNNIPAPFPILNQEEAQRIFSAKFLKDCGANDICESHLDVDGSLQMPRETLGINEPGYPSDKQVNVTIRVANNNEPAYESRLFVTHPASLIYSGFKATKQVTLVECSSIERNLVKCELGNPMPKGSTKLLMIFNTQNQAGTFDFNLMVNTTSQNAKEARTSYDLSGTIKRKVELQLPTKQPPVYPEPPLQEPPVWLILLSILLGILLFSALFYCLYVNGFFERSKARYTAASTDDRFN